MGEFAPARGMVGRVQLTFSSAAAPPRCSGRVRLRILGASASATALDLAERAWPLSAPRLLPVYGRCVGK